MALDTVATRSLTSVQDPVAHSRMHRQERAAIDALGTATAQATTTTTGVVETATVAEAQAGTDTSRYVTPEGAHRVVQEHGTGSVKRTGALHETVPRHCCSWTNQNGALVSGTLRLVACWLPAGATVTNVAFVSGTTAAVAPTNWWFGIFDSSRVCKKLTADQTSTAWAASTEKIVALTSAHLTTYSGLHYLGIMVAAGTVPSMLVQASANTTVPGLAPILSGNTSDTGLTTPPALPFTAGAITVGSGIPYGYVS